jgi:hypothetical protein
MAERTYTHTLIIQAPPERILAALARYEVFIEHQLHRNLVGVRFLGERTGDDGIVRRWYRNTEHVRFGPFAFNVSNTATSYFDAQGALIGEAFQSPGVHVKAITTCAPQPDGPDGATLVEETIQLTAPRLLMRTVYTQAKKAHDEKLLRLKAWLEAEQPAQSAQQEQQAG